MRRVVGERMGKAGENVKNLFSKEILVDNMTEAVFVISAFLAVILPVIFVFLSRHAILPISQASPNLESFAKVKDVKSREEDIQEISIDTSSWKKYSNSWYGFQVRYPQGWKTPQAERSRYKDANFEYRYMFRKENNENGFLGFDVIVYNKKRTPEIRNTDDIWLKESAPEDGSGCDGVKEIEAGAEAYAAKFVNIKQNDPCYEPTYFTSFEKNGYFYNIIPIASREGSRDAVSEKDVKKFFPEFDTVVASLKFILIKRPKPKPVITAPKPSAEVKMINGKRYCAKKNDKPRKSKNHKEKHMDMECCLDPDEYPNPWCTY